MGHTAGVTTAGFTRATRFRRLAAWATLTAFVAMVALVAGCSSSATVVMGERSATTTSVPQVQAEFQPTTAPLATAPASPEAAATTPPATPTVVPTPQPEGPCDAGPLALPDPDRPRYQATLTIDPVARKVLGELSVEFTPDLAIDELVVRLWPNGPRSAAGGVVMTMSESTIDGRQAIVKTQEPTLARVILPGGLAAGETVTFATTFEVSIPTELNDRVSARDDYMRLGTILPILPWVPGVGWATDPPTAVFAEAAVSPTADYSVKITVPDGYDVLASGIDDGTGTWHVEAARDFAISVGRFRIVSGTAFAPEPVAVTVGVHETLGDSPDDYLAKVIASLESFSARWGQYPWASLTFALTPELGGGIEFPTHVMQGPDTIGRTTSHEVGHMFFYSLVGNNQGAAPWLDEGMASYAEFTYEGVGAGAYAIPDGGIGQAAQPMTFWESRSDIYYRSVYGQTGFALLQLGTQTEVDCALARYVADNAFDIATADDFVAAFEPTFPDVVARMAALGVTING